MFNNNSNIHNCDKMPDDFVVTFNFFSNEWKVFNTTTNTFESIEHCPWCGKYLSK